MAKKKQDRFFLWESTAAHRYPTVVSVVAVVVVAVAVEAASRRKEDSYHRAVGKRKKLAIRDFRRQSEMHIVFHPVS